MLVLFIAMGQMVHGTGVVVIELSCLCKTRDYMIIRSPLWVFEIETIVISTLLPRVQDKDDTIEKGTSQSAVARHASSWWFLMSRMVQLGGVRPVLPEVSITETASCLKVVRAMPRGCSQNPTYWF